MRSREWRRRNQELPECGKQSTRSSKVVRGGQTNRRMDKVERVMKMVKRKKRGDGAREGGGAIGQPNSPDTVCDDLCGFNLCIGGEHRVW